MLSMLWSKGPGAPTLTGAAHSLSTRRVCTCVAFREKDPRARSVVVFSLNTDARGLLPERPTAPGCPDPERPTALGSFHVASGEEAALCEHPGVVILAYSIIIVVKSHRHHFHFIIVVTDQTLTLGWIASQG